MSTLTSSTSPTPSITLFEQCWQTFTTTSSGETLFVARPAPTQDAGQPNVICFNDVFPIGMAPTQPQTGETVVLTPTGSQTAPATAQAAVSSSGSSHSVVGPVVGSIVGAVVLALIIGAIVVVTKRRRQNHSKHAWAQNPGKWTFNELKDDKTPERPHEMKPTSPTSPTPNV